MATGGTLSTRNAAFPAACYDYRLAGSAFLGAIDDESMLAVFNLSGDAVGVTLPGSFADHSPAACPDPANGTVLDQSAELPSHGVAVAGRRE